MYPKVFVDFCQASRKYGPVSKLPTPIFFHGMEMGQKESIFIEAGKTLNIRLQAISRADENGEVRFFFELNGQPRIVTVTDRSTSITQIEKPKAEDGNAKHVGSPMPGTVSSISVRPGGRVHAGDVIMTIEAMKMETAIRAPRAATINQVLGKPGQAVDARDLLILLD